MSARTRIKLRRTRQIDIGIILKRIAKDTSDGGKKIPHVHVKYDDIMLGRPRYEMETNTSRGHTSQLFNNIDDSRCGGYRVYWIIRVQRRGYTRTAARVSKWIQSKWAATEFWFDVIFDSHRRRRRRLVKSVSNTRFGIHNERITCDPRTGVLQPSFTGRNICTVTLWNYLTSIGASLSGIRRYFHFSENIFGWLYCRFSVLKKFYYFKQHNWMCHYVLLGWRVLKITVVDRDLIPTYILFNTNM